MEVQEIKDNIIRCIEDYYNENNVSFNKADEEDFHLFLIDYFEILRKGIARQKRTVHISRELKAKAKGSAFKEWRERFFQIKGMFEKGEDVNSLLSKRARESGFRDRLLTCWDMHHLHFFPEKKFGDMLLFAIVKDDVVYMIDVIPHSKKYVFSTFELLNIVYRNWSFLIEPYRLKGITGLNYVIKTDEEVNTLRTAGISTAIQLKDKIYALDMMSTDGHNAKDVMYANQICNSLRLNEREGILENMKMISVVSTQKLHPSFILTYENNVHELAVWSL